MKEGIKKKGDGGEKVMVVVVVKKGSWRKEERWKGRRQM